MDKTVFAYTDYPFVELGDIEHQMAPIRQVEVLKYDGDKYCDVRLPDGQVSGVKAGYLYENNARFEDGARAISRDLLRSITS